MTEQEISEIRQQLLEADPSLVTNPELLEFYVQSAIISRNAAKKSDEPTSYEWLDQLPPEYIPPSRTIEAGDRVSRMTGQDGFGTYSGRGLINSRNQLERNADGTVKNLYGAADVQSIWRGIKYEDKKLIANYMKAFGVYRGSNPSLNLDQVEDFNAFARVLYTANNDGRTWDVALETLAKRYQEMPMPKGKAYKPTSIADIKRIMQQQATSILGRGLTKQEVNPLARQIQGQETRQQTRASGERPTSTSTLIEEGVQKQFAPEIQAFNFAKFAERAIGSAGSGAGVQSDPELEAVDG